MNELKDSVREYLAVRRALGFKLHKTGYVLRDYVSFAEREGISFITTESALRWATQNVDSQPACWAKRLSALRHFARYHSAKDPRTEIPPEGLLPYNYRRRPPFIFTDDDISQLIRAAEKLPSSNGLQGATFSTLFGLLAVTGMRMSEPIALNREDVNLEQGILTIRYAKFGKSRLVPLHDSTIETLRRYDRLRNDVFPRLRTPRFFVSEHGADLTVWFVRYTFKKLLNQIGLQGTTDGKKPRLHDLRHRFAIRTLIDWYRTDVDVDQHLPELSVYLGHGSVINTYWYLSSVPELLRLATLRMENPEGGPSS
ncbi:MAG: tyrosine-type recombinase/integrase [bacterium]